MMIGEAIPFQRVRTGCTIKLLRDRSGVMARSLAKSALARRRHDCLILPPMSGDQHHPIHQIEIRVAELSALFNSMDPTPFHERDLDSDAEEFIASWALEFPADSHFRIVVHLGKMPDDDPAPTIASGIHHYFNYKALLTRRRLRMLLLEGRTALAIGLSFLAVCMLLADLLAAHEAVTVFKVLKESLMIGGWVAMWRPLQIFLYEWWPLRRREAIYRSLGHARIHVTHGALPHHAASTGVTASPLEPFEP